MSSGNRDDVNKLVTRYIPMLAVAAVGLPALFFIAHMAAEDGPNLYLDFLFFLVYAPILLWGTLAGERRLLMALGVIVNLLLPLIIVLIGLKMGGMVIAHGMALLVLFALAWWPTIIVQECAGIELRRIVPDAEEQRIPASASSISVLLLLILGSLVFLGGNITKSAGEDDATLSIVFAVPFIVCIFGLISLAKLVRKANEIPQQPIIISPNFLRRWVGMLAAMLLMGAVLALIMPKNPLKSLVTAWQVRDEERPTLKYFHGNSRVGLTTADDGKGSDAGNGKANPGKTPPGNGKNIPGKNPDGKSPQNSGQNNPGKTHNEQPDSSKTSEKNPSSDTGIEKKPGNKPDNGNAPGMTPGNRPGSRKNPGNSPGDSKESGNGKPGKETGKNSGGEKNTGAGEKPGSGNNSNPGAAPNGGNGKGNSAKPGKGDSKSAGKNPEKNSGSGTGKGAEKRQSEKNGAKKPGEPEKTVAGVEKPPNPSLLLRLEDAGLNLLLWMAYIGEKDAPPIPMNFYITPELEAYKAQMLRDAIHEQPFRLVKIILICLLLLVGFGRFVYFIIVEARRRIHRTAPDVRSEMEHYDPFADPFAQAYREQIELIRAVYATFLAHLWLRGLERQPSQTEFDFATWLEQSSPLNPKPIGTITRYCTFAEYADKPLETTELNELHEALQAVMRESRANLSESVLHERMQSYREQWAARLVSRRRAGGQAPATT